MSITDAHSKKLEEYTKTGIVDLSIINIPLLDEKAFKVIPFTSTTDCFIASTNFEKDFLTKEEIKNYPLLLQKRPSSNRDYFENMCLKNNIFYTPNFEMSSFGLIADFVSKNAGIAYTVKDFILDDIKSGRVKELKTDFEILPRDIVVITNENTINNFATDTFIKELVNFFKK